MYNIHIAPGGTSMLVFLSYQAKIVVAKLILTAHSIVFPCMGIGTCTCDNLTAVLVLEASVKSVIGTALQVIHTRLIQGY